MKWFQLNNPEAVASPGLLIDPERIAANIQKMIHAVGGPEHVARLRPHVKTYKMPEVVRLQLDAGIDKFKVATISEASMVANTGAHDVLMAYQPVGPNLSRLAKLIDKYPDVSFASVCDNIDSAQQIAKQLGTQDKPFRVYIDVDCGMHRTGIPLGDDLDALRSFIESQTSLTFAGLHVYDGHIHDGSIATRTAQSDPIINAVKKYQQTNPTPEIIGGGSPAFSFWASNTPWHCSPGTPLLWDVGYGQAYDELVFSIAAALLTRVISKPSTDLLCLDLGYKAVASEMPLPRRVTIPAIPDAEFIGHSEEHLVIRTSSVSKFQVGSPLLAYPTHICPTVALYAVATIVRDNLATDEIWHVTARDR